MTDEQIAKLWVSFAGRPIVPDSTAYKFARALLSASTPAMAMTDSDLATIWAQADDTSDERGAIAYARAVLAAPQPAQPTSGSDS